MADFSDDFDRSDESLSASSNCDNSVGASMSVVSNQCKNSGGSLAIGITNGTSTGTPNDQAVSATIVTHSGSAPRLYARHDGGADTNHYYYKPNGSTQRLFKRVGGSNTSLGSGAAHADAQQICVRCVGTTITLEQPKATVQVTASSQTDHTSGYGGLGSVNTNPIWDDFEFEDLDGGGGGGGFFARRYYDQFLSGGPR